MVYVPAIYLKAVAKYFGQKMTVGIGNEWRDISEYTDEELENMIFADIEPNVREDEVFVELSEPEDVFNAWDEDGNYVMLDYDDERGYVVNKSVYIDWDAEPTLEYILDNLVHRPYFDVIGDKIVALV